MELTYENMLAVVKKFWDVLPGLTPENKHELEAICAPDCVFQYAYDQTEADHVSSHWEIYRAHLFYEPWPLYIMIDDKRKMANCVVREEPKHPVTGEIMKITSRYPDPWAAVVDPTAKGFFLHVVFEFKLHDGKAKIKTLFTSRIDENSVAWQRWRDLAKH